MNGRSDKEGSANPPAPIPPLRDLEKARRAAIGVQIRSAIEDILTKGGSVSERQLRKWGPDGTVYFFDRLRERINKEMPVAQAVAPPEQGMAAARARAARPTPPLIAPAAEQSAPVSTKRDWTAQQYRPWSVRTRAFLQGLIAAMTLFVGAAVLMRLWPELAAYIQQQLQFWR
jgi:hypothetical protein